MRLYLDDDIASRLLVQLLQRAGHDVRVPADAGLRGKSDAVHFRHAVQEARVCVSYNYTDYEELHLLIIESQGHHPGVWVVRRDNDRKRDLKVAGIARAIAKLIAAGVPIADTYHVLNQWR